VALAQGYLAAGDKTAEKFIPHPYSEAPGQRLYRTGDLVKQLRTAKLNMLSAPIT
jgi:non-ribosomal peptide synthetase component F